MNFTVEETNLIAIYQEKSRLLSIVRLKNALSYLDDPEMSEVANSAIKKLFAMTDEEFDSMEFVPTFPVLVKELEEEDDVF